jgi:AcrR family transcriptional regulator
MAAAELIGEVGPTRMRLSDIGARAGYSRGLATHYFGTKGELVRRIMDTVTDDFHKELAAHNPGQGALASINDIVSTYFTKLRENKPLVRARVALWAEAAAGGDEEERRHALGADERFRREIIGRLESGRRANEIPPDLDLEAFTTLLIGMLRGTAVQFLLDGKVDVARCEAEALAFVEGRLGPTRG